MMVHWLDFGCCDAKKEKDKNPASLGKTEKKLSVCGYVRNRLRIRGYSG